MLYSLIVVFFICSSFSVHAALNGPCDANGKPGVCIKTASCTSGGGTFVSGFCPQDPDDVKCCFKSSCSSGGTCMWSNQPCSGTFQSGFCPGPAEFKCCVKKTGEPIPKIPEHNCKRHAIDAGYKILQKFPGYVNVVWCYANKPGEHGKGLALDFMVGAYSPHGREIAEWVMNNAASLKVLYVIWGQKIWNVDIDKTPRSWDNWREMEDRGSVTANHWDHPHVSFKE